MSNLFDEIRDTLFDIVTNTIGYDATWIPSDGSNPLGYKARVLFKYPEADRKLSGATYSSFNYEMEYRRDFFHGLKLSVNHTNTEVITVDGKNYYCRNVDVLADGNTFKAQLELI